MERDFLGIGRQQNSGAPMKKGNRGGRMDSAISTGSPTPWPFSNKAAALQQFMSFQPIASVDAASRKACSLQAPEKSLAVERHGVMQFAAHAYQNQVTDAHRASTRQLNDARFATVKPHSSVPIAMTSPFLKPHGSSNVTNPAATAVKQQSLGSVALTPRNALRKKAQQLTIFYAGSVNVYDDVSCDMAKAIMLMASKECELAVHQRPEASVLSFSKGMVSDGNTTDHVVCQCSGLSSPVSIASHSESGGGPAPTDDKAAAKTALAQISTSRNDKAGAIMPNAVPQARKASLARFLEKRKERVSNMMPYSCEKKPSDESNALDDGTRSSKCSSADVSIPSNPGGSWCVGQTKSCSGDGYYPGIKLEM